MEYTKGKKAKAGRSFEGASPSRPEKPKVASAVFFASVVVLAVITVAVGLSIAIDGREAAAASFGVGITIPPLTINQTAPFQNKTAAVNGTNVSIGLPIAYNGTGLQNITMALPSGWKKVTNIRINESGVIKNVTTAGGEITFEANLSAPNVTLIFDAAPPALTKTAEIANATFFQKNLTVESENSFTNASVSIDVNSSFTFYTLYWHNGNDYVDKTIGLNLRVTSGIATFDSFNTSTVLFRVEGSTSCTESWSCTGWSSSPSCGTRTCTDSSHCGTTNSKPAESASCTTPAASGGGGGGGGWGTVKAAAEEEGAERAPFNVDRLNIKERVRRGELKKSYFTVTNTGAERLRLDIVAEGESRLVSLDVSYLELEPGTSRTVGLLILGDTEMDLGVYTSTISIRSGVFEKTVAVSVEVTELKSIFDVVVTVSPRTKSALAGSSVIASIEMFNLAAARRFDVDLIYGVKDYSDLFVVSRRQALAVETRASVVATLDLPGDIRPGTYSFIAYAQMNGINVGVGSDTFEVLSPPRLGKGESGISLAFYVILMVLIAAVCLLILLSALELVSHHLPQRRREGEKEAGKAAEKALGGRAKPVSRAELERKLRALEQGFSEGIVSVKAYIEDKVKIENELKRLKNQ